MKSMKVSLIRRTDVHPEAVKRPALPNGLICPLSWEPLTDPVIAPNGLTYNADAIYPYVNEHGHLPTDNRPVTPSKIWPDQNMRDRLSASPLGDPDEHLEDPITYDTMTHPVVASDGRTYNQSTLERLFRQNNGISPFSRAHLATTGYRNQTLMTELNPQIGQARSASLAAEPTRNLVNFELPPGADDAPPIIPNFVRIATVLLLTMAIATVLGLPALFPVFAFSTAGIVIIGSASLLAPLASILPNIYAFFSNRAARH